MYGADGHCDELAQRALQPLDDVLQLGELRVAIVARNHALVHRLAHTVKGAVGNFASPPAIEAAQRLEIMGKENRLDGAGQAFAELEQTIERLKEALKAFTGASNGTALAANEPVG